MLIPGEAMVSQADPVCLAKRLRDNRGHKGFCVGAQGTEEAQWRGICRGQVPGGGRYDQQCEGQVGVI